MEQLQSRSINDDLGDYSAHLVTLFRRRIEVDAEVHIAAQLTRQRRVGHQHHPVYDELLRDKVTFLSSIS